jgi:excisionase family DNA binding protein
MRTEERLSLQDAADALGISEQTARRWVKTGKLKAYKPGLRYLIPASAISELLEGDLDPKVTALPSSKTDAEWHENPQLLRETLINCHALLEELASTYKEAGDFDRLVTLSNIVGFSSMGGAKFVRDEIGPREGRANKRVYAAGERLEELLDEILEHLERAQPTEEADATILDFAEHLHRKAAG